MLEQTGFDNAPRAESGGTWQDGYDAGYPDGVADAHAGNKKNPPKRGLSAYSRGRRNGYLAGYASGRADKGV